MVSGKKSEIQGKARKRQKKQKLKKGYDEVSRQLWELHEKIKVTTQHMKTSILKEILREIYIDIICCLIGLVALYTLCHQIDVLGVGVFNAEPQKPVNYAKTERNVTNLLIFAVISISGIVYGGVGVFRSVSRIIKSKET